MNKDFLDAPQAGRRYNYWLAGKDNYAVDRQSGEQLEEAFPGMRVAVRENRHFMHRAAEYLATSGVTQFLDIGAGIPQRPNVHNIVHAINPHARILYTDNDPVIGVHGRALLAGGTDAGGISQFEQHDLRDVPGLLTGPAGEVFDLSQPVAVLIIAVLHFIGDDDHPHQLVADLMSAFAPGSYLALTHVSYDLLNPPIAARLTDLGRQGSSHGPFHPRSRAQINQFFTGLELQQPGLVPIIDWHQFPEPHQQPGDVFIGGVGRKP